MSGAPHQLRLNLTGADIHLDCLLDGDDIELDVHFRGQRRRVRGDQVRRHKTEIGTLATVDIRTEPRRPWIGLSVMLPSDLLEGDFADGPQPVRTFAVETTGQVVEPPPLDSPAPLVPESGGLEPYRTIELAGTVSRVTAGVLNCQQWSAVRTIGYDRPDEISVRGYCVFPRAGYTARLEKAAQQPTNPDDLRLQLSISEPAGSTTKQATSVVIRYDAKSSRRWRTVTIVPDGLVIPVETTAAQETVSAELTGDPSDTVLEVRGKYWVPKGGYQVTLRRAEQQGRPAHDLLLQVEVREPGGSPPKDPTTVFASYVEGGELHYRTVTTLPNNVTRPVVDDRPLPIPPPEAG
jgi:hypothetical protein